MPKAEVIKPARFRWTMDRQISQLEKEAQLKESIAKRLQQWGSNDIEEGRHYTATQALVNKFTKDYFNRDRIIEREQMDPYHGGFDAYMTRGGRIGLYPIPVVFQLLNMAAVAPFSVYRARKRDPEIFAKRIAGNIWLSKDGIEKKHERLQETIQGLLDEAEQRLKIAAQLKTIRDARYAKGEAEQKKKKSEKELAKNRVRAPVLVLNAVTQQLLTNHTDEVKQMEDMLAWIGENELGLKAGRIRRVPDSSPHLIQYNDHLFDLPELSKKQREGRVEGLKQILSTMIELRRASLEYQLAKFEKNYQKGEGEENREQKQGN